MAHNPNSELVTLNFIRSLGDFNTNTTLPDNANSWKDGFVQVTGVAGAPNRDVPTRRPVMQIDCWVPSINSSKPQWGKANTLAEDVVSALYNTDGEVTYLSLGPNFKDAIVQSAFPVGEPRRISNDPAGHARYTFGIQVVWVVVEPKPALVGTD